MPRYFVRQNQIADGIVNIVGDDAHHISRSLRMAAGEYVTVSDMQKNEYDCEITAFTSDSVAARVLSSHKSDTEPPYKVRLFQALPKSDKMDVIIQKSVETGAHEIIPFESERCVVKKDGDSRKEQKKLERRSRIALEAAKQCGRGTVPEVMLPVSFDEMIKQAAQSELALFFYEGDGTVPLRMLLNAKYSDGKMPKSISVIIGSEGGFSLKEVEKAREAGFDICGLGRRILRCETAPSFVLACLTYNFEL